MSGEVRGSQLHVEVVGASGPPLVFLHAFAASSFTWRHWVPDLSRDHRLFLVDLKGFGASPTPHDSRYGPVDHARLVVQTVVDRDLRGAVILGHSMGGGVALLAALQLLREHPGRLGALVLLSPASLPQKLPLGIRLARLPCFGPLGVRLIPSHLIALGVLIRCFRDPRRITREQVAGYARPFRRGRDRHGLLQSARQLVPPDLDELIQQFPEVRVPTLLLSGRHDRIVPLEVSRRLAGALPQAELVILEDCGHAASDERPTESLCAIRRFLEDLNSLPTQRKTT